MNKELYEIHGRIADRAKKLKLLQHDKMSLLMDLEAAQIEFNLDCSRLLAADDFNFSHDIVGIQNHINRQKCNLFSTPPKVAFTGCFLPRFSRPTTPIEVEQDTSELDEMFEKQQEQSDIASDYQNQADDYIAKEVAAEKGGDQ